MILVTGGAGFIGSRLIARLRARGHEVVSVDDYSTGSDANHHAGVRYLRAHTDTIAQLGLSAPKLIFHLGEYSRVEASFADAARVYASNVVGSAAVFDLWQRSRAKLVYAGSSTLFATGAGVESPYARSKRLNSIRVRAIGVAEGLPWAVTYFYNVYGPGERAGAYGTVVEIFRQQATCGEPLSVVAPGTQRRNFTHVDDIVDGLLLVAAKGIGKFPIGAEESYSVLELAALVGGDRRMLPARLGNRDASRIDTSAVRALGWTQHRRLIDYVKTWSIS